MPIALTPFQYPSLIRRTLGLVPVQPSTDTSFPCNWMSSSRRSVVMSSRVRQIYRFYRYSIGQRFVHSRCEIEGASRPDSSCENGNMSIRSIAPGLYFVTGSFCSVLISQKLGLRSRHSRRAIRSRGSGRTPECRRSCRPRGALQRAGRR